VDWKLEQLVVLVKIVSSLETISRSLSLDLLCSGLQHPDCWFYAISPIALEFEQFQESEMCYWVQAEEGVVLR
jgi:hypothetical protein